MARNSLLQAAAVLSMAAIAVGSNIPFFYHIIPQQSVPQFYVYQQAMVAMPVTDPARRGIPLPCPTAGFFVHPTNCSRFYRCVDYTNSSSFFSRYEFQCPQGQRFVTVGKNTCVPGDCDGSVAAAPYPGVAPSDSVYPQPGVVEDGYGGVPLPPQSPPVAPQPQIVEDGYGGVGGLPPKRPPVIPQPGITYPTSGGTPPTGGGTVPAVGGGAYPKPGGGIAPQPVPYPPRPTQYPPRPTTPPPKPTPGPPTGSGSDIGGGAYPTPGGGSAPSGTGEGLLGCPARYVQDAGFCNIYLPCPVDGKRYVCTIGSVFDQARQMCRLDDRGDLCAGKPIYKAAIFRTTLPVIFQPQQPLLAHNTQLSPLTPGPQQLPVFNQGPFTTFGLSQHIPSLSQHIPSLSQPSHIPQAGFYSHPALSYPTYVRPVSSFYAGNPMTFVSPVVTYYS